jgi:hypothetical protein
LLTRLLSCDGTSNGFKPTRQVVDALFLPLQTDDKELGSEALLEVCPDGSNFCEEVIGPARSVLEGRVSRRAKDGSSAYEGKNQDAQVCGH